MILLLLDTDGILLGSLNIVLVEQSSLSNIHSHAPRVVFCLFIITRYVTSLPVYLPKSAIEPHFQLASSSSLLHQAPKMVLIWILLQMAIGEGDVRIHMLM